MKQFAGLALNFLPSECRIDTLEGKDYAVVPMVILTEGVHSGTQGPCYYPKEELSKTPAAWNHKPIVVYHPGTGHDGIGSACTPEILNTRKIGIMLNTKYVGGRLKSEAWIDVERADEVDERIMVAVNSKEVMELSTGVFIDVEEIDGKWKNEEYVGIARNFRPDHLALLPDQIGACSIADGAGLLRNAERRKAKAPKDLLNPLTRAGLVENVVDVFSNFFIYEKDGKLFRLGYVSNEKEVTLSDETPVEVERLNGYRTVDGSLVGNQRPAEQNTMKTIKEKVDGIIAANAGWGETDRENLLLCTIAQLDTMLALNEACPEKTFEGFTLNKKEGKVTIVVKNAAPAPASPAPAAPVVVPAPAAPAPAPVQNKVVTTEEYINQAPKEVREVLSNGLAIYNEEKVKLVESILANANNGFTKEDLGSRPLGELRNLARLASAGSTSSITIPHFGGQAPVADNSAKEEALVPPVMDFDKKAA